MKRLIKNYYIEIILVIIALAGIILLVGNFSFQDNLVKSANQLVGGVMQTIRTALNNLSRRSARASNSELAIAMVIFGALGLVFYRIRSRYRRDPDTIAEECPRCGNTIKRIHRTWFDKLLGNTLMPNSRRYACTNQYCGWKGLRRYQYRHENMREVE